MLVALQTHHRRLCLVLAALTGGCATDFVDESTTSSAVTPRSVPATIVPITINVSPGDQGNPRVDGDIAAYTSDLQIRYYRFSTGVDTPIPLGPSARDLLSSVSGSRIAFSRIIPAAPAVTAAVVVFDVSTHTLTEIDPALGTTRLGSAIAGGAVAYIDFGLQANGELVLHEDLVAGARTLRLTNDTNPDQNPFFSSDGTVVVWEHCNSSLSNCDILQAVRTINTQVGFPVWTLSVVAATPNQETNPDTNGTLVVYDSFRAGNSDIYWAPVSNSGGPSQVPAETRLELPGFESTPRIAGNFIVFESRPGLLDVSDLYLYDLINNLLYQVTSTPLVTEQLSDVAILPDGTIRLVWASDEDGSSQRNVRGATITPSPSLLLGLVEQVSLLPKFGPGIGSFLNGLIVKLEHVLIAVQAGDTATACSDLKAFINQVNAQSGKKIATQDAISLIAAADAIRAGVGCP